MKIYVAMHKIVNLNIKSKIYQPLLVGSFNKDNKNILRDDSGDNISHRNENYCELTGIYWIWKNSNEEIVGLCHYRRFLTKKLLSNSNKFYLTENDIRKDFNYENVNMILPQKNYFKGKIISNVSFAPNEKDMEVLRNVLIDLYPEYIENYDAFLKGNSAYLCNVMITTKDMFDNYAEWLFNVLFETEKRMNRDDYINDPYRKRMFGFLSERLLNVWILQNKRKLKIKEYPMINTEQRYKERLRNIIVQKLRGIKNEI